MTLTLTLPADPRPPPPSWPIPYVIRYVFLLITCVDYGDWEGEVIAPGYAPAPLRINPIAPLACNSLPRSLSSQEVERWNLSREWKLAMHVAAAEDRLATMHPQGGKVPLDLLWQNKTTHMVQCGRQEWQKTKNKKHSRLSLCVISILRQA